MQRRFWLTLCLLFAISIVGCERQATAVSPILLPTIAIASDPPPEQAAADTTSAQDPQSEPTLPPMPTPIPPTPSIRPTTESFSGLPTPDPPHFDNEGETTVQHSVAAGETLGYIATLYGSSVEELLTLNNLNEFDFLSIGQIIVVPTSASLIGPDFKIIPDSELVYGPSVGTFNTREFLETFYPASGLLAYQELVEGRPTGGPEIVTLVAVRYSVHPRLLLAAIEYRTGWVSRPLPASTDSIPQYMLNYEKGGYEGLFQQLNWVANRLNEGYYGRSEGGRRSILINDGTRVAYSATINHGTAAIQNWLAADSFSTYSGWLIETGPDPAGFYATYTTLFGNPFGFTVEGLRPDDLAQPPLALPWETGVPWYFTGGPHGGWAAGSAWAALDFAPDADQLGCYVSETWVTAASGGRVVFSDYGGVLIDMDGDGDAGTGWVIVYWHLATEDRVPAGEAVRAGDRLGHASCEGGYSVGTHLHIARRYNGVWIAADGDLPFVMEGWTSSGTGREYDGFLVRGDQVVEACACAEDGNEMIR